MLLMIIQWKLEFKAIFYLPPSDKSHIIQLKQMRKKHWKYHYYLSSVCLKLCDKSVYGINQIYLIDRVNNIIHLVSCYEPIIVHIIKSECPCNFAPFLFRAKTVRLVGVVSFDASVGMYKNRKDKIVWMV